LEGCPGSTLLVRGRSDISHLIIIFLLLQYSRILQVLSLGNIALGQQLELPGVPKNLI
jgi:hypothetical protein